MKKELVSTISRSIYNFFHGLLLISNQLKLALAFIMVLGLLLLWLSDKINSPLLHEFSVLSVTITPILFVYESVLRQHLQRNIASELRVVIRESKLQQEVISLIQKSMPASYQHILRLGISDVFPTLDSHHFRQIFETANNCVIKIVKIWIPYLNEAISRLLIVDALKNRGCSLQIVLFDTQCMEPLIKRARSTNYNVDYYKVEIEKNLLFLHQLYLDLKRFHLEHKLEVRMHDDFIGLSLIGSNDYYLFGTYLHGRVATLGMQYQVDKMIENDPSNFYCQLDAHFDIQWQIAHVLVTFNQEKYGRVKRIVKLPPLKDSDAKELDQSA